jgi:hypothetical protein
LCVVGGESGAPFWAKAGSATREAQKRGRIRRFSFIYSVFSVSHAAETRSKAKRRAFQREAAHGDRMRGG